MGGISCTIFPHLLDGDEKYFRQPALKLVDSSIYVFVDIYYKFVT